MQQYALQKFDADKLAATHAAWLVAADTLSIPSLDYSKQIEWVSNHMDYSATNDSLAYGLFDASAADVAVATIDIVHTKRTDGGWLKMLQLFLSPKYAPSVSSAALLGEMFQIYGDAIIGTISLTDEHPSRTIKIYARDDFLMTLLVGIESKIAELNGQYNAHFEGRFLVISTN